jgi:hypothetical protein
MDNSQKYIDLMDAYKMKRRENREAANKIREEAMALLATGTVSADAEEAVRYM